MITQVIWTDVNNRELDNIYARVGDDELREIHFIICRNDPPEKVEIPAGVSGQFRMIKSSGNFVVRNMTKTVKEDGTVIFTVSISDQMVNVQGTGYYDIRLSGGGYLYTASGRFIVDTPVISTNVLEDVSEVNGLVFPDDFLTKKEGAAVIDDTTTSIDSTWSSQKISNEINEIDLTNYATKQYVDSAISGVSAGITYSTTPVETGLFNGKKVYTVMSNNFSVTSTSNSNWVTRILNAPSLSKLLSVKLIANYLDGDYTAMVFPVGAFYNARSKFIEMSGSIQSGWDSITFEMAIIEYVEV